MRIESNKALSHKRLFILPTIEYEYDWGDRYLTLYFLYWKIIFRLKRK